MNRVKEFRVKLNMSQLQLSREIDVSRQAINMIENDKYNPSLELCIKLGLYLSFSIILIACLDTSISLDNCN